MFSQFGPKWPVWQCEVEPQVEVNTYEVDGSNRDIIQSDYSVIMLIENAQYKY